MKREQLIGSSKRNIFGTYRRQPVVLRAGRGRASGIPTGRSTWISWRESPCAPSGIRTRRWSRPSAAQAGTLMHVSNLYYTSPRSGLAEMLVENSFADRVFFCNSGAEANEAAIKLARKYSQRTWEGRLRNHHHGKLLSRTDACDDHGHGSAEVPAGFEPLPEGFRYVPFNDVRPEEAISTKTCAVMVEPIQGEGGVKVPSTDYLRQSGSSATTGGCSSSSMRSRRAWEGPGNSSPMSTTGSRPDIMTLAKGLGNGFPWGPCRTEKVAPPSCREVMPPPSGAGRWSGRRPWRCFERF